MEQSKYLSFRFPSLIYPAVTEYRFPIDSNSGASDVIIIFDRDCSCIEIAPLLPYASKSIRFFACKRENLARAAKRLFIFNLLVRSYFDRDNEM